MTNQALIQRDITDQVSDRVQTMQSEGLTLPTNYNASNALKSAFFALQNVIDRNRKPALEVCTKTSIANALLDMVTQGLSPAKTQCYFIVYGDELQLQRSYFGTQAVLKRLNNVEDIWANVIYQDDVFDYEITDGRERLIKHETTFLNRDKEILGAYAVIKQSDGDEILTVMTKKEIDKAWSKTKTGGGVQKDFPQEMAKRTVINRAAKAYINTSDDSDMLIEAINRSTENEYDNERTDVTPQAELQKTIETEQAVEMIDFDEPTIDELEEIEEPVQKPKHNIRPKQQQEIVVEEDNTVPF